LMAAGEGAGAGMAAGLAKSRPLVEGAVSDMVDAMVAKAEADLGMGSPATRFIPHGVAITEAIGLGMLEGSDYLNDIMALIGDNLTGQAADIVNGILAMMGGIGAAGGGDGGMMPLPTGGISVAPDLQLSFEDTVKNQLRGIKNAADEALRLGDTFYANLLMERLAELQEFYGITSFAKGGVVPGPVGQPQLAMVHGGEIITPMTGGFLPPNIPAMFRGGGKGFIPPSSTPIDRRGGGRTVIEVPVYLDGREIARVTSPYLADELQQHGIRALG